MISPIAKDYKGLISITGPTKSGKSKLAEFLIKDQESITYIATATPRKNDPEWSERINVHKRRRPKTWKLIEHPKDICKVIKSVKGNESILIDSLGGLVVQYLSKNNEKWESFQSEFINAIINYNSGVFIVSEEVGWGLVSSTPNGHLFRERLSNLSFLVSRHSNKKWLAVNGTAIDLDMIGYLIP